MGNHVGELVNQSLTEGYSGLTYILVSWKLSKHFAYYAEIFEERMKQDGPYVHCLKLVKKRAHFVPMIQIRTRDKLQQTRIVMHPIVRGQR